MAHLNTQPGDHDLTASAFIVDISEKEPRLWLHMHRKLGCWLQFGGHVEQKETPWQGVCHEIEEESGFDIDQLKILQPAVRLHDLGVTLHPTPIALFTHKFADLDHYHSDIPFAFVTTEMPRNQVSVEEDAERKLFSKDELLALSESELPLNVRQLGLFVLDEVLQHWEAVDTANFQR